MQSTELLAFGKLLQVTGRMYRTEVCEDFVDVYWMALERFAFDEVKRAISQYIQSADFGQFMPKPGDIIRLIEGDSQSNSQAAWAHVDRAVRGVGPYQTVVFDDPITMRVIQDMGGWIQLCSHDEEDYTFRANEFTKRYQSFSIRPLDHYPNKLIGITESSNGRTGHGSFQQPVVMVGDRDKCVAIYHRGKSADEHAAERRVKQAQFERLIQQQPMMMLDHSGSECDETSL